MIYYEEPFSSSSETSYEVSVRDFLDSLIFLSSDLIADDTWPGYFFFESMLPDLSLSRGSKTN